MNDSDLTETLDMMAVTMTDLTEALDIMATAMNENTANLHMSDWEYFRNDAYVALSALSAAGFKLIRPTADKTDDTEQ